MRSKIRIALSVLGMLAVAVAGFAADPLIIDWYTIDDGGRMRSTGGGLELSGTIAQRDAGRLTAGTLVLTGGFWFELAPGDCDDDGDVDLLDFGELAACLLGPGGGLGADCGCFDLDDSGDVDLLDFANFSLFFTG